MHKGTLLALAAAGLAVGVAADRAAAADFTIKLSYWVPPTHLLTPGYKDWAASVEKDSHGTIKTKLYPSSQLGSGKDHYDMVKRGVADFGLINPGYTPGRFPVAAASDLPFMISDALRGAKALTAWYAPYAKKEMADEYVCHVFTHHLGTLHTTKKQVRVPADVKGLNIRTANETMARFITELGGNSVQVPIMEAKDTLAKGITDGITVTMDGVGPHSTFKFNEVTKYSLDIPLYVSSFTHNINKRMYERMSADQKKVIDDHCTPEWSAKVFHYWYDDELKDLKEARALKDHVWTEVGPKEVQLWRDAAKPVYAHWSEAVKKAGWDPDKVMAGLKAALQKENALF
jgi:TRAP-type C4-dicarboxylate transport system substrate-binding protein